MAFEAAWLDRVKACVLRIYEMPEEDFELALPEAGYWISRRTIVPRLERSQGDLVAALVEAGAEVRILQDFWPLCDAVAASTNPY